MSQAIENLLRMHAQTPAMQQRGRVTSGLLAMTGERRVLTPEDSQRLIGSTSANLQGGTTVGGVGGPMQQSKIDELLQWLHMTRPDRLRGLQRNPSGAGHEALPLMRGL